MANAYVTHIKLPKNKGTYQIQDITSDHVRLVTWASGTDQEIATMLRAAYAGNIDLEQDAGWAVGDERTVSLSSIEVGTNNVAHASQTVTLVLMDTDHYYLADGTTKCQFVVGFKECLSEGEKMDTEATNSNGWHNSRGRKACDAIVSMLPLTTQYLFKEFQVKTATRGGTLTTDITTYSGGKLALFAEKEIFGVATNSKSTEAEALSQIEYFKVNSNRIKAYGTYALRSPLASNTSEYCGVSSAGATINISANGTYGFAPFGVI